MRIIFSILCLYLLLYCTSQVDENKFERVETGDYPFLPLGTTVDSIIEKYGLKIDTILYKKLPKQTIQASRIIYDSLRSTIYIYTYENEVVSYTERFSCNSMVLEDINKIFLKNLHNLKSIDSLWKFGDKVNAVLVRSGNDYYSTGIELPDFTKGCQGCVCRIFSSLNVTFREDLIEEF